MRVPLKAGERGIKNLLLEPLHITQINWQHSIKTKENEFSYIIVQLTGTQASFSLKYSQTKHFSPCQLVRTTLNASAQVEKLKRWNQVSKKVHLSCAIHVMELCIDSENIMDFNAICTSLMRRLVEQSESLSRSFKVMLPWKNEKPPD